MGDDTESQSPPDDALPSSEVAAPDSTNPALPAEEVTVPDGPVPELASIPQGAPVLPRGALVQYVSPEDGLATRVLVLAAAADGGLTVLLLDANGRREVAGVRHDAGGAPGTWHEAEE